MIAFLLAIVYLGLKLGGVGFPVGNPTIVIVVVVLQRHPAALARRDRRVRRADLRRVARPAEVHRRVPLRLGRLRRTTVHRQGRSSLPPVCILAGGLGTRLGERVRDTPKPLLEVAGEPFLMHQLRLLAAHGAREVVLCVGYRGEQIEARIGERALRGRHPLQLRRAPGWTARWARSGARCRCWASASWCSTATPTCGSTMAASRARWEASGLPAVMTVLRNEGRWDASNAVYARRHGAPLRQALAQRPRCAGSTTASAA